MPDSWGNLGTTSSTASVTSSATITDLVVSGSIQFTGGNVSGTYSALLGANAPALVDALNPSTWITVKDANGNLVCFPVWRRA